MDGVVFDSQRLSRGMIKSVKNKGWLQRTRKGTGLINGCETVLKTQTGQGKWRSRVERECV